MYLSFFFPVEKCIKWLLLLWNTSDSLIVWTMRNCLGWLWTLCWAKVVSVHFPSRSERQKNPQHLTCSTEEGSAVTWAEACRVSGILCPSSLRAVSLGRHDALLQLLSKQVTGSPAVRACGALQRRFQRPKQRRLHVLAELELKRNLF